MKASINMFRIIFITLFIASILSACAGGVSGTMSASALGYWQVYKVNHKRDVNEAADAEIEGLLDNLFSDLGFKRYYRWHSPLLNYSRVATFKQKYKDRYINIYVEAAEKHIILMSTSYSSVTEKMFNHLEFELAEAFGKERIEQCYGVKDIYGHTCFKNDLSGSSLTKLFSDLAKPFKD